jgi:hypothetical protein
VVVVEAREPSWWWMGAAGWPTTTYRRSWTKGFIRRHVLGVLTGVAMKTLSNYMNHSAKTPLDDAFASFAWTDDRECTMSRMFAVQWRRRDGPLSQPRRRCRD